MKCYAVCMRQRETDRVGIHSCWYAWADANRIAEVRNGVNGEYWVEAVEIDCTEEEWKSGTVMIRGSNGYIPVSRSPVDSNNQ